MRDSADPSMRHPMLTYIGKATASAMLGLICLGLIMEGYAYLEQRCTH
jgi:hypothetical protein